jgi:hypothetical protein
MGITISPHITLGNYNLSSCHSRFQRFRAVNNNYYLILIHAGWLEGIHARI